MDLWSLSDLATPWCLRVAATLRLADRIQEGHTEAAELAAISGAHPESLVRLLRHLSNQGIFEEPEPGRFAVNEAARGLLDGPLRIALDLDSFGGRMAHPWSTLLQAVRTGRPAYREVFGLPFWDDLEAH